ncbi:MAG: hypothetical protein WBO70_07405 [Erysipelotrichaceae bacterium]
MNKFIKAALLASVAAGAYAIIKKKKEELEQEKVFHDIEEEENIERNLEQDYTEDCCCGNTDDESTCCVNEEKSEESACCVSEEKSEEPACCVSEEKSEEPACCEEVAEDNNEDCDEQKLDNEEIVGKVDDISQENASINQELRDGEFSLYDEEEIAENNNDVVSEDIPTSDNGDDTASPEDEFYQRLFNQVKDTTTFDESVEIAKVIQKIKVPNLSTLRNITSIFEELEFQVESDEEKLVLLSAKSTNNTIYDVVDCIMEVIEIVDDNDCDYLGYIIK